MVQLAEEGFRFTNKLWNLGKYTQQLLTSVSAAAAQHRYAPTTTDHDGLDPRARREGTCNMEVSVGALDAFFLQEKV